MTKAPITGRSRIRLDIAYDGTEFSGWARQPDRRTVQGIIEGALSTVLRMDIHDTRLTVAGRTDAGVHATGQVAHVDLPDTVEVSRLLHRLVRLLPPDVSVRAVTVVPESFDARFSALRRHYVYRICDDPRGVPPLRRRDTVGWRGPLDVDRMNEASRLLLGLRDFCAFCKYREGATTIRELQRFEWRRVADHDVIAQVTADAFCHSMVRSIVGAVLAVGQGRKPVEWPARLLAERVRSSSVTVAPAKGLTLVGVDYPQPGELAARAHQTRAVRQT